MHLPRDGVAVGAARATVGSVVDERHAVREEELKRLRTVVGKRADDLSIVVTVVRVPVGLRDRPVG
ncbi:hypothetical protein D3C83_270060 [compost metagenome]